eukprot:1026391-Amphidinium_carterae.2
MNYLSADRPEISYAERSGLTHGIAMSERHEVGEEVCDISTMNLDLSNEWSDRSLQLLWTATRMQIMQQPIALSSAESEWYAMVRTALTS